MRHDMSFEGGSAPPHLNIHEYEHSNIRVPEIFKAYFPLHRFPIRSETGTGHEIGAISKGEYLLIFLLRDDPHR